MKYFMDTEFIEYPYTIDLISIGIVSDNGREFYAESSNFDESKASQWVKERVISKLWSRQADKKEYNKWTRDGGQGGLLQKNEIGGRIIDFIRDDEPEFWGYYADYDWVVFCWLFGSMINLPDNFPMYCRDLKQLSDEIGKPIFPEPKGEHNALDDARWNRDFYNYLTS